MKSKWLFTVALALIFLNANTVHALGLFVATAAICEPREADCETLDLLFHVTRSVVQVAPNGVVTSSCVGIGPKPAKRTSCDRRAAS
jgi:hypothetical protein